MNDNLINIISVIIGVSVIILNLTASYFIHKQFTKVSLKRKNK